MQKKTNYELQRMRFLPVFLLLAACMLLIFESVVKIYSGWQQRNWPLADGTVTATEIAATAGVPLNRFWLNFHLVHTFTCITIPFILMFH